MPLPILRGERVTLRPGREEDVAGLVAILAEPEIVEWWGDHTAARVRRELVGQPGWAIEIDGELGGWLSYHEEDDPDYRHAGFDIFVASGLGGRGYVDPAAANERAIRAYAAVGFRPVGRMREYERGHDGTWHDGLLMDLLASELRPARAAPRKLAVSTTREHRGVTRVRRPAPAR